VREYILNIKNLNLYKKKSKHQIDSLKENFKFIETELIDKIYIAKIYGI